MKLMKRLLLRPARRLGRTVINLLIFDLASAIYGYSKGWFREPRTTKKEKEEEGINDWLDTKHERRRG